MRALLISGFQPSHDAVSSGPKLVAREIDKLTAGGFDVTTVSFENELDRRHFRRGFERPRADDSRIFPLKKLGRIQAGLRYPKLPLAASARRFVARAYVEALLARVAFDRIDVEFIQAAEVLPRRYWPSAGLVSHDVLHQLYQRRLAYTAGWRRIAARTELARVSRWEGEVLRCFGTVTVLNDKDRDLVKAISGRSDIGVRYPEVPRYIDPSERTPDRIQAHTMLFWGHMGRAENVDAVHYFAQEIMPLILAKRPNARLVVAGIDPPDSVRLLERGGHTTVTGFVQDPAPLFRRAALGVVPVRLGAGIKVKTLEMIACGLPVVATTAGAEGVVPSSLLTVADAPATFAQAVLNAFDVSGANSSPQPVAPGYGARP